MTGRDRLFLRWQGWRHVLFAALLSAGVMALFLVVYGGADWITSQRSTRFRVHLDAELEIPFVPAAVIVYSSIYLLFLAAPFVLRTDYELTALAKTLAVVIVAAGIGFLLLPAELAYPPHGDLGPWTGVFHVADRLNLEYNLVPSLHVTLSVVCVAVLSRRLPRMGRAVLWTWALAVAISTLLTHQHHLLDVLTGWLLGMAGVRCVYDRTVSPAGADRMKGAPLPGADAPGY